jgi:hypothetical protein
MKVKIVSELISTAAIGTLAGLVSHGMREKWHLLGRQTYLAKESQRFDKFYANPAPAIHTIVIGLILALLVFALYKGLAFAAEKLLSAFSKSSNAEQG